mmetsp:Transcript_8803/g.20849  ORF Transcript_8803/g.20849 Transcript_8803/m.20849 type:complete len:213 (+) Transcript_8803:189-827(+)
MQQVSLTSACKLAKHLETWRERTVEKGRNLHPFTGCLFLLELLMRYRSRMHRDIKPWLRMSLRITTARCKLLLCLKMASSALQRGLGTLFCGAQICCPSVYRWSQTFQVIGWEAIQVVFFLLLLPQVLSFCSLAVRRASCDSGIPHQGQQAASTDRRNQLGALTGALGIITLRPQDLRELCFGVLSGLHHCGSLHVHLLHQRKPLGFIQGDT